MMKSLFRFAVLSFCIGILFTSCQKDSINPTNYQDEFVGNWMSYETTGINAPQRYPVSIEKGVSFDQIIIKGLYNDPSVSIAATIDGFYIDIPQQKSDSISFVGSGQANADFDQITINFTANDGGGDDVVKAVLTK